MARYEEAHKEHINKYKMAHNIGVAEYMRENAAKYGLDGDTMYVAGLLHDIGYLNGRMGHEAAGLEILNKMGVTEQHILFAVANHGKNLYDVEKGVAAVQNINNLLEYCPEIVLMCEADMSVNAQGYRVGFKDRLEDIGRRYGTDGIEYQTASATVEYVKEQLAIIEKQNTPEYIAAPKSAEIYQLRDEAHNLLFMNSSELEHFKKQVDYDNYKLVYQLPLEGVDRNTLENLYNMFNMNRPEDFTGHSMSVSDVIVLKEGDESKAYFVDSFGFKEIEKFQSKELTNSFVYRNEQFNTVIDFSLIHSVHMPSVNDERTDFKAVILSDDKLCICDASTNYSFSPVAETVEQARKVLDEFFKNSFDAGREPYIVDKNDIKKPIELAYSSQTKDGLNYNGITFYVFESETAPDKYEVVFECPSTGELCDINTDYTDFDSKEEAMQFFYDNISYDIRDIEEQIIEISAKVTLPTITVEWSESPAFEDGKTYSVAEFNSIMKQADKEFCEQKANGTAVGYDKVKFTINDLNVCGHSSLTERQDVGDGYGGIIDMYTKFSKFDIVNRLQAAILYDEKYMQGLVDEFKKAFEALDMERAYECYSDICNSIGNLHDMQAFETKEKYMVQLTDNEIYTITDYGKDKYYKELDRTVHNIDLGINLDVYACDEDPAIRCAVISRLDVNEIEHCKMLDVLVKDDDYSVRAAVVRKGRPQDLKVLANDDSDVVRETVRQYKEQHPDWDKQANDVQKDKQTEKTDN